MIFVHLFYEFFKIGLFSFGGGYATIPFLYHIGEVYGWFSGADLERMIAIASVTPGPIGVNMATYTGLTSGGLIGSLIATTAITIPSLILIVIISKILKKFRENFYVKAIIYGLKPASCALLASVALEMIISKANDLYAMVIFVIFLVMSFMTKKDPLFYLGITGLIGLIIFLVKL